VRLLGASRVLCLLLTTRFVRLSKKNSYICVRGVGAIAL